ncbi:MAG: lysylphosphatidylglycerol synthase transmembrane domain-containing protein [Acidiferrobacterales bacterium]
MTKLFLRLVITVLLFVLIFRSLDVDHRRLLDVIQNINYGLLIPAILLQVVSTLVASYRWYLIMHVLEFGQSLFFYIGSYFKGTFFNQALPTSIGGDAVRILDIGTLGSGHKEAFYGVFIDRVIGLSGLMILNLIAILLSPDLLPPGLQWVIALIASGGIVGVVALLLLKNFQWLTRLKITRMFHHISNRMNRVYHSPISAAIQTGLSLLIHLLTLGAVFLIGRSIGIELSFLTFLVLVPPALLLTIVPVSLAGWGVRETALIGLFQYVNGDKTLVLAMSMLFGLMLIVAALPGLYFYLTGHTHRFKQLSRESKELAEEITEEITGDIKK